MSVSVRVPTILRPYTQGVSEVSAEGSTLIEVLESLDGSYPGIRAGCWTTPVSCAGS